MSVNRFISTAAKISLKPTHYPKLHFKLVLDELHLCELVYHCSESESHYSSCLVHFGLEALLNTIRLPKNSRQKQFKQTSEYLTEWHRSQGSVFNSSCVQ